MGKSTKKALLLPLTARKKVNLKSPTLNGVELNFSTGTKCFGVILDSKVTWNAHLRKIKEKGIDCIISCRLVKNLDLILSRF